MKCAAVPLLGCRHRLPAPIWLTLWEPLGLRLRPSRACMSSWGQRHVQVLQRCGTRTLPLCGAAETLAASIPAPA